MKLRSTLLVAVLLIACPLAASDSIDRGIDAFTTLPNGETYYDFAANPIPAGFFCAGSPAFTGRVVLGGAPIATEIPGALRGRDTVLERLDDAVFDSQGVAETRVRFRALALAAVQPIDTGCGPYELRVGLDGKQQTTTMRIYRSQPEGGTFYAPLKIDARLFFRPASGRGPELSLPGHVTFPATPIPWSFQAGPHTRPLGPVTVDTDGDSRPDTDLAGSSNFAPGWAPPGSTDALQAPGCGPGCITCEPYSCHLAGGEQHCTGPVCSCNGIYACP